MCPLLAQGLATLFQGGVTDRGSVASPQRPGPSLEAQCISTSRQALAWRNTSPNHPWVLRIYKVLHLLTSFIQNTLLDYPCF